MHLILVDDHPLFREALRSIVRLGLPEARIEEADSIEAANEVLARRRGIDLIVLDLSMRGISGFEGLIGLRGRFPRVPILVCSGLEEPRIIREAIRLGAAGFVPKSAPKATYLEAFACIMNGSIFVPDVHDGPRQALAGTEAPGTEKPGTEIPGRGLTGIATQIEALTPAQMSVLALVKRGKINKHIAYELGIGVSMVKAHVSEIMRKLGAKNRTQVAISAAQLDFDRVGL